MSILLPLLPLIFSPLINKSTSPFPTKRTIGSNIHANPYFSRSACDFLSPSLALITIESVLDSSSVGVVSSAVAPSRPSGEGATGVVGVVTGGLLVRAWLISFCSLISRSYSMPSDLVRLSPKEPRSTIRIFTSLNLASKAFIPSADSS